MALRLLRANEIFSIHLALLYFCLLRVISYRMREFKLKEALKAFQVNISFIVEILLTLQVTVKKSILLLESPNY